MADVSEQEHYSTLVKTVNGSTNVLCKTLKRLWREETRKEWDAANLKDVLHEVNEKGFENPQPLTTIAMGSKRLEEYDISALSFAILSFRRLSQSISQYNAVSNIYKMNNDLVNNHSKRVSSDDYKTKMEEISKCLELLDTEEKLQQPNIPTKRNMKAVGVDQFVNKMLDSICLGQGSQEQAAANTDRAAKLLGRAKGHYKDENDVEARKLFQKVAEMDTKLRGKMTLYKCNAAVADAQGFVGIFHAKEENFEDYKQAATWFEKGMEYGNGLAALSLGVSYNHGLGVLKDPHMAEMCFRESLNLKLTSSTGSLVNLYLQQLEPEKANIFYRTWIRKEPELLSEIPEKKFERMEGNQAQLRQMMERLVKNFENKNGLDGGRALFMQRLCRALRSLYTDRDNIENTLDASIFYSHAVHCIAPATFTETNANLETDRKTETMEKMVAIFNSRSTLLEILAKQEEISEEERLQVLDLLYEIINKGLRLVPCGLFADEGVKTVLGKLREQEMYKVQGKEDEKLRVCCAMSNLMSNCDEEGTKDLLRHGISRYPNNLLYHTLTCLYRGNVREWRLAKFYADKGLQKDPNNVELMFLEAVSFSFLNSDTNPDECVSKYGKFLELAPEDDPNVPDAWYAIAGLHLQKIEKEIDASVPYWQFGSKMDQVKESFDRGLEAEKRQLSCFLPYRKSVVRLRVELALDLWKRDNNLAVIAGPSSLAIRQDAPAQPREKILDRKMYLKSPTRKGLIKLHRQNIKEKPENTVFRKKKPGKNVKYLDLPMLQQTLSEGLSSLKLITLLEMPPTVEHIFKDRLLQLTILAEPFVNLKFLATVAEDKDGDVIRVHVYNFENEETKFSVGSRIAVINPYLSMTTQDSHSCIRIDDLRCVIFQRNIRNMCGFCGEENSSYKCSKCKGVYCSKECEGLDVQRHCHNLVCA